MSEDIFQKGVSQFEKDHGVQFKPPQIKKIKKCFDAKSISDADHKLFQRWTVLFDDAQKIQEFIKWLEEFVKNPEKVVGVEEKKPVEKAVPTEKKKPVEKAVPTEEKKPAPKSSPTQFSMSSASFQPSLQFKMDAFFTPSTTSTTTSTMASTEPSSAILYASKPNPFASNTSAKPNPFATKSSSSVFSMSAQTFVSERVIEKCEKGLNCDDILCAKSHPETLYSGTKISLM